MANFITIFRVFLMFIAVYLIIALPESVAAYVWALVLTVLAFALDGVDGWVARKFHEESKLGALLDIMSDRIVENTYWILFAVQGWISILFPLIAITRGFITDTIRSAAMEKGFTPFGMQQNPICKFNYRFKIYENFLCCCKSCCVHRNSCVKNSWASAR